MKLTAGDLATNYIIDEVKTNDEELDDFLFTLGCFKGERITIVSRVGNSLVVAIKDGRYNIDTNIADAIIVE